MFADLIGKGGHIRTVPIPDWVAAAVHAWLTEAVITEGAVFRAINKAGRIASGELLRKAVRIFRTALDEDHVRRPRVLGQDRSICIQLSV